MNYMIYSDSNEHMASTRYAEDAAGVAAMLGAGTTVRDVRGFILWWEGHEKESAAESYDNAAETMQDRARNFDKLSEGAAMASQKRLSGT